MDTYQAQYRVLEAFSLFNVILIWEFLLFLLTMAVIQDIWLTPVTSHSWFGLNLKAAELPIPVVSHSQSRGRAYKTEDQTYGDDNGIDEVTLQWQIEEEMGRRDIFTFTILKTGLQITNPS
ncbi:hypothetical protein EDD16DRAFT_1677608 [Pisolithus croceorrhizus]|nr:hypothetical protein EDD16DRAFT_1677608 [Pisolithus croceorrhizus]KAI6095959.1 hypothetical protein EV401DRAFT_2045287 [Pisolithus croceorrhizus]